MKKIEIYKTKYGREFGNEKLAELAEKVEGCFKGDYEFINNNNEFGLLLDETNGILAQPIGDSISVKLVLEGDNVPWETRIVLDAHERGLYLQNDLESLVVQNTNPALTPYEKFNWFERNYKEILELLELA